MRPFPGLAAGVVPKPRDPATMDKTGWLGDGSPIDYGYDS